MAYTDVFGGSTVQPADVQFAEVTLTASITTDWPEFATTTQAVARIMQVSATVASLTIALPDAQLVSNGQDVLFDNAGANTFEVLDYAGAIIATVAPGEVRYLYLDSNATAAGTWRVVAFGSTSSAADASQLAGYGIKATSATLSAAPPVVNVSSGTTVVAADRAKVFVWTGASGTLTLPTTVGSTSDFVIEVRNQGTGTVTLAPVGGVSIDSSLSISLSVNESCFVHMGATDWYTVGRGRNTNFNFTQLSKAVTGGTAALTLTEASNVVQTYTGVLLSNQIVTLPAVVQVYYVRNNTTGAFTLTFACAGGGSSVVVSAAQAAILFCDGTNIINANTSLAGGITALLFGAGSATVPSAAFGTSTNGFYASGTNEVAVTINGSYVGKWTSAGYQGNVALAIAADGLTNATTTVTTSAAAAPTAGQVLMASSGTAASWVTPTTASSIIYSGRTSNTILGLSDKGYLIDITSGTFSQTLDAAATLGSGWWCYIRNSGTGVITIDPNGGETINGATTYTLNSGSCAVVQCNGSVFRTVIVTPSELVRIPIFSAQTQTRYAVSSFEDITPATYSTGLTGSTRMVVFGNSLFLAASSTGQGNIASSANGTVWTLRAMPSSAAWSLGTNGTNQFIATVGTATTVAKSTDGITWSAGTALPSTASNSYGAPAFNGSTCLVVASAALTAYVSTDNATTWSAAQTLLASANVVPIVIGGLFWYWNTGTTAYTSATGLTGSWTLRTLPVTPINQTIAMQTNGKLAVSTNTSGAPIYETSDGINWTLLAACTAAPNANIPFLLNGIYVSYSVTLGQTATYANGAWTPRVSTLSLTSSAIAGSVFVAACNAGSGLIVALTTTAIPQTAIFTT